jgi:hypothetical protein
MIDETLPTALRNARCAAGSPVEGPAGADRQILEDCRGEA